MPIRRLKKLKDKHLPKGSFRANVMTLMVGTAIAQAIPILFAPLLTRLYTPVDFGIFALYTSVVSIISVIATARYELAIMLPENDEDAINLVALSVLIAFLVGIILFIVILIYNRRIVKLLGNPAILPWLYFIPLAVLLNGVLQAFNYWLNRRKQFQRISLRRILQSGIAATTQLTLGTGGSAPAGLILGGISGQAVATGVFSRDVLRDYRSNNFSIEPGRIKRLIFRYKDFPRFDIPSALVNVLANQLPVIMLGGFFGSAIAGFYGLTQGVLAVPIALVSSSILDVFKQKASSDYIRFGNCRAAYIKVFKALTFFSATPFLILFFFSPQLFAFIFGEQWRIAGEYAQIMSLMYFFKFISSPLSFTFFVAEKQRLNLLLQTTLLTLTVIAMFLGVYLKNPKASLFYFSLFYSAVYILYLFLSYHFSKGLKRQQSER